MIGPVLQAPDAGARNQVIVAHMQRMEAQLAATQSVVASLRSLLAGPPGPIAVERRPVGAVRALAIREPVPMAGLDPWWDEAFRELDTAVAAAPVPPAGPRAALYPAEFFQLEAGEITAYVPVTGEVRPAGRAAMVDIPAAELAVAVHKGAMADLDQTYGALGTYVARRGIGAGGPIREHYLVTALDTDDESHHLTEVGWPVSPAALPS